MENKNLSKKIMSIFWCILYCMPLVILIITYIGYLNSYKENANIPNYEIEYIGKIIEEPTAIPKEGTINKFYVNHNLKNKDLNNIVLNSDIYNYLDTGNIFYSPYCNVYTTCILDGNFSYNGVTKVCYINLYLFDYHTIFEDYEFLGLELGQYFYIEILVNDIQNFYVSSEKLIPLFNQMGYSLNVGWNNNIYTYDLVNDYTLYKSNKDYYYSLNEQFKDIFSITPYVETEKIFTINGSLFDLSVKHINNTFNGFVWSPIYAGIDSFINVIGFKASGLIYEFLLLIFTWFIQLSFIRILIDFFTLLPNLLRNLFKGVS